MKFDTKETLDAFSELYIKATKRGWKHFRDWNFISPTNQKIYNLKHVVID